MFYVGKYNRGRRVEEQWVFGDVERGSGRCYLLPVPNRTADTTIPLIHAWIELGICIYSDGWKVYPNLS